MTDSMKPRSHDVTTGPQRAGARAMLRAVGMTDSDWDKPQVGIASSWNEVTPCNLPLAQARPALQGRVSARRGGYPLEFNTIAVSDGISMGHEGMRASLVSRELIADSVEAVMHAERLDASVSFAGCDKSLPGMLMAAARLNLPNVFVYGGSILPGNHNGNGSRHRQRVRGRGRARGRRDRRRRAVCDRGQRLPRRGQLRRACSRPTRWPRSARRWACRCRAAPPPPRSIRRRDDYAFASGTAVLNLLKENIRPRHIMTKAAFENAIAVVMALGGLDQRRAPPAGDRLGGWRRAGVGRLQQGRGAGFPTSPTPSPTANTTWSTSIGSAACRWSCGCCSKRAFLPRRRDHRHRQDRRREPGAARPTRPPTATWCTPSTSRSTTSAALPC